MTKRLKTRQSFPTIFSIIAGLASLGVVAASAGCGSDDGGADTSRVADTGGDDVIVVIDTGAADTVAPDTALQDTFVGEIRNAPPDFRQACESNADCDSGWCVATADGALCTKGCDGGCPAGWTCGQVVNRGTDLVSVCLDRAVALCSPCVEDADCNVFTEDTDNRCISMGADGVDGGFCGMTCGDQGFGCPPGYECAAVEGGADQCVPTSGVCECGGLATELALVTECGVANGVGTCWGERFCDEDGLTGCDAPAAVVEICNNIDDDCNGETDDGIATDTACDLTNNYGTCVGVEWCVGGAPQCVGVEAQPEICDGQDQDCDGTTDEGFADFDQDGAADCVDPDDDGDGTQDDQDCAPFNDAISKSATETCNNIDDDCDGQTDEQDATGCTIYWRDVDGDGQGNPLAPTRCLCAADVEFDYDVTNKLDCNDLLIDVKDGGAETCNLMDDDCDGATDEGVQAPCGGCDNICLLEAGPGGDAPLSPDGTNSSNVGVDASGHVVLSAGQTSGSYRHRWLGWPTSDSGWAWLFVDATLPANTSMSFRYRTAASVSGLAGASWSATLGPYPPATFPIELDASGHALEVEVQLRASAAGTTPTLEGLSVLGQAASAP